jgi:excisionase family DNA binding protein
MVSAKPSTADAKAPRPGQILDPKWDGRSTFTVEEAGEICGISRPSAYAAAKSGTLPTVRIGRRCIVPRHALERLLLGEAQSTA